MGPERLKTSLLRSRWWAVAAVCHAAVLLATLGIAPKLWFKLLPYLQPHVTRWYLGVLAIGTALLMLWTLRSRVRRGKALVALVAVLGLYVLVLFGYYAREAPAKKFHLLEYGVLTGLTLQAVRVDGDDPRGLACGLLFLAAVGTVDEFAQGHIPMRTFRLLDLFGNYVSCALGALAWAAASPQSPWRREPETPTLVRGKTPHGSRSGAPS